VVESDNPGVEFATGEGPDETGDAEIGEAVYGCLYGCSIVEYCAGKP